MRRGSRQIRFGLKERTIHPETCDVRACNRRSGAGSKFGGKLNMKSSKEEREVKLWQMSLGRGGGDDINWRREIVACQKECVKKWHEKMWFST